MLEPIQEVFPTLYKRDSKGKVRVWCMELNGDRHRTIAGLQDGKLVTSEWTECSPMNIGKRNERSAEEQALSEIEATYKKKLSVDYHNNIEDIDTPKIFKPMLATKWEDRKAKMDWGSGPVSMQAKFDGIRCIATSKGLFSRTGKPILSGAHIIRELEPFFEQHPNHVLDGELYNHLLKDDFNKISSIVRKTKPTDADVAEAAEVMEYHVYDVASGIDAPYTERHTFLTTTFKDMVVTDQTSMICIVTSSIITSEQECDDMHSMLIKEGYEGSIIRLDEPYAIGKRSNGLMKRKDFIDEEFIILEYVEADGNWAGLPKVLKIQLPNGIVGEATMKGSREYLQEVKDNWADYVGKEATITHFGFTPAGKLRHGNVKTIHLEPRI